MTKSYGTMVDHASLRLCSTSTRSALSHGSPDAASSSGSTTPSGSESAWRRPAIIVHTAVPSWPCPGPDPGSAAAPTSTAAAWGHHPSAAEDLLRTPPPAERSRHRRGGRVRLRACGTAERSIAPALGHMGVDLMDDATLDLWSSSERTPGLAVQTANAPAARSETLMSDHLLHRSCSASFVEFRALLLACHQPRRRPLTVEEQGPLCPTRTPPRPPRRARWRARKKAAAAELDRLVKRRGTPPRLERPASASWSCDWPAAERAFQAVQTDAKHRKPTPRVLASSAANRTRRSPSIVRCSAQSQLPQR
jgi:hypothetical protein